MPGPLPVLQGEKLRVDIETVSPLTAGQTVVDIYRQSPLPANVFVAKVSEKLHMLLSYSATAVEKVVSFEAVKMFCA